MEEIHSNTYKAHLATIQKASGTLETFLENIKQAPQVNFELLKKILDDNKDTEYGRKYGFDTIDSVQEYQRRVPVIVYDNIAEHLERMRDGEKNVLTAYQFDHMNTTSGTVGNPKLVPMTVEQQRIYTYYNHLIPQVVLNNNLPPRWMEGRAFCTTEGSYKRMPSGITVGCASSKMADYIKGGAATVDIILRTLYTSPVEATNPIMGDNNKYVHARFALMDGDITGIVTGFYSHLVLYFKYISDNWQLLIDDIEKGVISDEVNLTASVRESLMTKIAPMPERAAQLREIFKNGSDIKWVSKVWPKLLYISGVGADGFSMYDKIIKENYLEEGTVKHFYSGVVASEGLWSMTLEPDCPDSVLVPQSAFFEFLPVEADGDLSQIVTMDKVQKDHIYELIVTNLCGFYRYRTSDAVRVTGFVGTAPLIQFMYRVNKTINLVAEKTTEKALQWAVENACNQVGIDLSDFSVYADPSETPGQYVFLVEPRVPMPGYDMDILQKALTEFMYKANPSYERAILNKRLSPLKVHFMQPETSLLYRDMMTYKGASQSQLKPVHIISNELQRKFFFSLLDE
ncbi:MAG: GH3 auxin-responsive promoter family protein [Bacteroidaceae bacterium]|nr:GH3 auxin-responsive promoter family protein [Bacteroidaceae bacterium]